MTARDLVPGLASVALLLVAVSVIASAARRRWLAGWSGSPARLAEAVIAIATITIASQLLGALGLLGRSPLLSTVVVLAAAATFAMRRWSAAMDDAPGVTIDRVRSPAIVGLLGATAVGLVATQWLLASQRSLTRGVAVVDSLHYHLPIAARFAQSGRTSDLHFLWIDPVWTFYPANVELHHAVGMVLFGSDVASSVLNLAWLALALLAAWVLGRRHGVGHLCVGVVALLFAMPLYTATQPGSALNDAAAVAFLIATLALVAVGDRRLPAVAVAGSAAGLAAGTKVTTLAPLFAITVVLVLTADRGSRRAVSATWLLAMFSTGGFWYVRNLVRAGSPLPVLDVPGLPSVDLPIVAAYGRSVAEYVDDAFFWTEYVWPGLRTVMGPTHPIVFGLAAAGTVAGVSIHRRRRETDPARARIAALLLAGGLLGSVAYVFTPVTAYGPADDPFLFAVNLRYLIPGLACLLLVLVIASSRWPRGWRIGLMVLVSGSVLVALSAEMHGPQIALGDRPLWFAAGAVAGAGAWGAARTGSVRPHRLPPYAAAGAAFVLAVSLIVLLGRPGRVLDGRYRGDPISDFAGTLHDERIAVVGYTHQYLLTGRDGSNHVQYLGERRSGGGFHSHRTCEAFRRALHDGDYGYLVAGTEKWGVESAPELGWVESDAHAEPVLEVPGGRGNGAGRRDRVVVFRVEQDVVDTSGCPGSS